MAAGCRQDPGRPCLHHSRPKCKFKPGVVNGPRPPPPLQSPVPSVNTTHQSVLIDKGEGPHQAVGCSARHRGGGARHPPTDFDGRSQGTGTPRYATILKSMVVRIVREVPRGAARRNTTCRQPIALKCSNNTNVQYAASLLPVLLSCLLFLASQGLPEL